MRTRVKKEGRASSGFFQSICVRGKIIKEPTSTKAMELAMDGISESKGEKNKKGRKSKPAVIAVRPVLPPAEIPTADSM